VSGGFASANAYGTMVRKREERSQNPEEKRKEEMNIELKKY